MGAYRAVLFDIDDTLIDFKSSEKRSLQNCHEVFFKECADFGAFKKNYFEINQPLWRLAEQGKICPSQIGMERFKQLAERYAIAFDPETVKHYENGLLENSEWIEGATDLLENLKENNIKIGFVTNGFAALQRSKYRKLNLARYSDVLVISEEIGVSKPHPTIFLHTLDQLQVEASHTLMVGDSLASDGEGARGVNMPFCWYNPNQLHCTHEWQPDQTISHLLHLKI
jgi:YjjG family noncanonical pyrimidine nucleotidase